MIYYGLYVFLLCIIMWSLGLLATSFSFSTVTVIESSTTPSRTAGVSGLFGKFWPSSCSCAVYIGLLHPGWCVFWFGIWVTEPLVLGLVEHGRSSKIDSIHSPGEVWYRIMFDGFNYYSAFCCHLLGRWCSTLVHTFFHFFNVGFRLVSWCYCTLNSLILLNVHVLEYLMWTKCRISLVMWHCILFFSNRLSFNPPLIDFVQCLDKAFSINGRFIMWLLKGFVPRTLMKRTKWLMDTLLASGYSIGRIR